MVPASRSVDIRRLLGIGVALAAAYIVAARIGFSVAFVAEQVTTVWAPTGLAQAALLLWGRSLWPAVWLGAFVANTAAQAPMWTAVSIATGNTLEAVVAAWLLSRVDFDPALRRTRDGVAFIVIAAGLSTAISATVGVVTLCASHVQPWARFSALWSAWWVGDALGALVVVPVIVTVVRRQDRTTRRYWVEALGLIASTLIVTQVVFSEVSEPLLGRHPLEFVVVPFVIAAAVRLGQPATGLVVLGSSAVTIGNTLQGTGPFADAPIHESLILLQVYTGVLAGTGLLLAAAITERKTGERRILEEQRRTRATLDRALDAVISMDHDGKITEFNAAAERTFGCTRDLAVGRALADFIVLTEFRERLYTDLRRYLATGEGPFMDRRIETAAHHAAGHEFPVEVSITRVMDEPPLFTAFVRDLTARAEAEREREKLLVREQTARREAEAANRAKDEFLATLSHELRTPLNAIVGWARMLLEGTMDERSSRRALEVIDRNAHLQVQLVEDILDVSRIITGGLRLDISPVDLATVIGAALDAVRPAADAKKIRILCRLDALNRLAEGDPQRLQQIVWNLLSNAVKFTAPGGLIEVELVDAGDQGLRISVRDNGVGIAPSFLPFVFERFRQADGSVNRQHGGLGLGLAIVRHLVELHGGTVRVESEGLEKGATFIIDLPRMDSGQGRSDLERWESIVADRPASIDALVLRGRRALVVDDEEDARVLLATVLKKAGATVKTASTVREALSYLDSSRPDVLLADVGMPGEDGYFLIREIRRREGRGGRHLPAAAITAYAGIEDRERALRAGFDCHVSKPVVPAQFVRTVVSLCGGTEKAS